MEAIRKYTKVVLSCILWSVLFFTQRSIAHQEPTIVCEVGHRINNEHKDFERVNCHPTFDACETKFEDNEKRRGVLKACALNSTCAEYESKNLPICSSNFFSDNTNRLCFFCCTSDHCNQEEFIKSEVYIGPMLLTSGTITWDRDWDDYKFGFDDYKFNIDEEEYFIGLEFLHDLTNYYDQCIVNACADECKSHGAFYVNFKVMNESSHYSAKASDFHHHGRGRMLSFQYVDRFVPFSTRDNENQRLGESCATNNGGGWWYRNCRNGPTGLWARKPRVETFTMLIACGPADLDYCLTEPCLNGGTCHTVSYGFSCTCPTLYTGTRCEAEIPKTCAEVGGRNRRTNGTYVILPKPSEMEPFNVTCQFEGTTGKTVVGHDTEVETQVTCEPPRCYKRNITYSLNDTQIRAIIDVSNQCRQYLKYRCTGSVLHYRGRLFGGYAGPDGMLKNSWAGTNSSLSCVCGEAGTCVVPSQKCNCDHNRNSITSFDDGYVTVKSDLPVSRVEFGDAGGSGERAHYTVGKLECY